MVFKKKKVEEAIVEAKEEIISPTAEELVSEEEVEEEIVSQAPAKAEDLDNQLNIILNEINNRLQVLESFNFRLKNI
jgi:hypothetical protein